MNVVKYITSAKKPEIRPPDISSGEADVGTAGVNPKMTAETKTDMLKIEIGGVFIQIPRGKKEGIRLARAALDFMENFETTQGSDSQTQK